MQPTTYYIGLDVHKRKISYCVKDSSGKIHTEGSIAATRLDLGHWMKNFRGRGVRRWKRRCSRAGFEITSSPMPPL